MKVDHDRAVAAVAEPRRPDIQEQAVLGFHRLLAALRRGRAIGIRHTGFGVARGGNRLCKAGKSGVLAIADALEDVDPAGVSQAAIRAGRGLDRRCGGLGPGMQAGRQASGCNTGQCSAPCDLHVFLPLRRPDFSAADIEPRLADCVLDFREVCEIPVAGD